MSEVRTAPTTRDAFAPHAENVESVLRALDASTRGLSGNEVVARREKFGRNVLPEAEPPGVLIFFLRQFLNPLIYVLLVSGEGLTPVGEVRSPAGGCTVAQDVRLERFCLISALCNEAALTRHGEQWTHHGDTVDVSLLVLAHKAGLTKAEAESRFPPFAAIPYESERGYAATLNASGKEATRE
jgi:magnesium-transporting ATPase (P-type)